MGASSQPAGRLVHKGPAGGPRLPGLHPANQLACVPCCVRGLPGQHPVHLLDIVTCHVLGLSGQQLPCVLCCVLGSLLSDPRLDVVVCMAFVR